MFKNYFKTAWKSLWNSKFFNFLNLAGLATGLATGILLLIWVQHELSYDKFNPDYKNIYQLSAHFVVGGKAQTWPTVPGPLAVYAKNIPELRSVVRIKEIHNQDLSDSSGTIQLGGNTIACVDTGFFSMFNYKIIEGNKITALSDIHSVLLTQACAKKFFGQSDPMGKTIIFYKTPFTVSGVLQDFPDNSSMKFDAVFPMKYYGQLFTSWGGNGDWKTIDEDVGDYSFDVFVELTPGSNPKKTGMEFSDLYKKARNGDSNAEFRLENLGDIHLVGADGNTSDLRMVQIFMLVVVLLLSIASINYINLSTARSLVRAKEVSIRKIVGAGRLQLFLQFTLETVLLFGMATVLGLVLIYLLMPIYNGVTGTTLQFSLKDPAIWKAILLAVSGSLIASSIYPALVLSSFEPMEALKGKISSGVSIATLRKGLVVFQFSISVILLVGTLVIGRQLDFIRAKDLGYDKSYVFAVPLPNEMAGHLSAVETELGKESSIHGVGASDAPNFADVFSSTGDIDWEGKPKDDNMLITQIKADKDFIPTMKFQFLEGQNFRGTPADSGYYILNETAVKQMQLSKPYVGRQISFHNRKGTIVGVVKDFNFQSLKTKIGPVIFFDFWDAPNVLYVRTSGRDASAAIASVEKLYKKYSGNTPFNYRFLDKSFDKLYRSEAQTGTLFNLFSTIAILISCLGLLGLSTYTAQVKKREIGIRKVLGASVPGIVGLISSDFLKLVMLAILIAIPLSVWLVNRWLNEFAYRIGLNGWVFAIAGAAALVISFLTISFQAISAARANPVNSIRTE